MSKSKLYKCSICGLEYRNKKFAKKCEEWCKKHNSCNLEITKHAIKEQKGYKMFRRIKEKILVILGPIFITFGSAGVLFGTLGLCCTPLTGGFLAFLGIGSVMLFLVKYNWLFLSIGIFLLILTLYFYLYKKTCRCNTKLNKK